MVAQAATSPLPILSQPDRLRLPLYFAALQSTEALALELLEIHRQQQSHLTRNAPPSPFAEALTTENTALASVMPTHDSGLRTQDSFSSSALSTQSSALPPPPDPFDLAAWTLTDAIAPHIAYRRAESLERRKQSALHELDAILATSDSPIEKRRAATTMLRMLTSQLHRNRVSSSPSLREGAGGRVHGSQQSPPFSRTPSVDGSAPSEGIRGGGGSVSAPATNSPSRRTATSPRDADDRDSSSPHSVTASLSHSVTAPSPATPPFDVVRIAATAIKSPDLTARAAFENHLSPSATINHGPIFNTESQLSAITPKLKVIQMLGNGDSQITPGPPETHTSTISLIHADHPSTRYEITLTRSNSNPHPNSWLISDINPIKDTS